FSLVIPLYLIRRKTLHFDYRQNIAYLNIHSWNIGFKNKIALSYNTSLPFRCPGFYPSPDDTHL
ncbi:hypothetical protein, partial [Cronobacter sakazakii]|uniref:hypothetical protein n=1 Tax=Cronobacter sakazakii TaxID=28141 RepID=UPI001F22D57C